MTGHLNGLSERLGERQIETLSESAKLFSKVLLEFLSSSFQVLFEFFSRILFSIFSSFQKFEVRPKLFQSARGLSFEDSLSRTFEVAIEVFQSSFRVELLNSRLKWKMKHSNKIMKKRSNVEPVEQVCVHTVFRELYAALRACTGWHRAFSHRLPTK